MKGEWRFLPAHKTRGIPRQNIMKTAILVFAEVFVMGFDILTVAVTVCWICGAMNIGETQGTALTIMWVVGVIITSAIGIGASEEEWW